VPRVRCPTMCESDRVDLVYKSRTNRFSWDIPVTYEVALGRSRNVVLYRHRTSYPSQLIPNMPPLPAWEFELMLPHPVGSDYSRPD